MSYSCAHDSARQRGCSDSDIEYIQADTQMPYDLLLAQYLSKRSLLG